MGRGFQIDTVELLEDQCIRVGSQIGKKLLGLEEEREVHDEEIVTQLTQARKTKRSTVQIGLQRWKK